MGNKSSLPARKQPIFRQIEGSIGRGDIANSLAASSDLRAFRLLDMMLDPAYASLSFGQLCSRAGLSAMEVTRLFCQKQVAIGMMRLAQHLPDILEQTAVFAMSYIEKCERCGGSGVAQEHTCRQCRGKGEVRVLGHLHRVRLVLEIAGLLPHKAGRS